MQLLQGGEKILLKAIKQIKPLQFGSEDACIVVTALASSCIRRGLSPVQGGFATQPVSILQVDTDTTASRVWTSYHSLDMRSLLKQPEIQMYFNVSRDPLTASGMLEVVWQMLFLNPPQRVRKRLPLVQWRQKVSCITGSQNAPQRGILTAAPAAPATEPAGDASPASTSVQHAPATDQSDNAANLLSLLQSAASKNPPVSSAVVDCASQATLQSTATTRATATTGFGRLPEHSRLTPQLSDISPWAAAANTSCMQGCFQLTPEGSTGHPAGATSWASEFVQSMLLLLPDDVRLAVQQQLEVQQYDESG